MDERIVDPGLVPPVGRPGVGDPLRPYRSWATVLCALLVIVGVVGLAVVVVAAPPVDAGPWIVAVATAVLGIGVFAVEAVGLQAVAPWAVHAIRPLCLVLIVGGVIRAIAALSATNVTIPLEAIGALLVLTREHGAALMPSLDARGRRTMLAVVGLAVLVQVGPAISDPLRRGAVFGAPESALALQIDVSCEPAPSIDVPAVARVAWSWGSGEPVSPTADGVRIEWTAATVTDDPSTGMVRVGERVSDPARIAEASGSEDALRALDDGADVGQPAATYRVDLARGLLDGWIELDLAPSDPTATSGGLEVSARYAHGGRWIHESGTASCVW